MQVHLLILPLTLQQLQVDDGEHDSTNRYNSNSFNPGHDDDA